MGHDLHFIPRAKSILYYTQFLGFFRFLQFILLSSFYQTQPELHSDSQARENQFININSRIFLSINCFFIIIKIALWILATPLPHPAYSAVKLEETYSCLADISQSKTYSFLSLNEPSYIQSHPSH